MEAPASVSPSVEEQDAHMENPSQLRGAFNKYRSALLGATLALPVGAIGGGFAVDRQYTEAYATVAPVALADAVNADKADDMELIRDLNLPLAQDVSTVRNALQGLQDLLGKDVELRTQANGDFIAALESIDEYEAAEGLADTYRAAKKMTDAIPAAYASISTLLIAQLDANGEYSAQMGVIAAALSQMLTDLNTLEIVVGNLEEQGLGDFGENDQAAFGQAVNDGMRQQSWVYRLLHRKD